MIYTGFAVDRKNDFRNVIAEWLTWESPQMVEREMKLPPDSTQMTAVVGPRRAGGCFTVSPLIFGSIGTSTHVFTSQKWTHQTCAILPDVEGPAS